MAGSKKKDRKIVEILGFETEKKALEFAKKYEINSVEVKPYFNPGDKKKYYKIVQKALKII